MKIRYPEALPVSRHREVIRDGVRDHQVVIVCGDTGSGKTTQLPKIALELGRGRGEGGRSRIGCTQPRRIAATSVARRVAQELGVELGLEVGYQVRFDDRTTRDRTQVKFMTDGILLAETRGDPVLRQYDTLIIDEAHERSLNIDFILGYLHRLLPRRPDLKVLISSATLDAAVFSDFFRGAPVIEVEGRTFPVEDVWQPPIDDREPLPDQVARAAEWLAQASPLGDTLVFLPGEREIREAADLLAGRRYPHTVVLPLFARLAAKDQEAVFQPAPTRRRIILATNVAETSLTIPDIHSVIDSGIARMSRFDPFAGIQRLQVERISKASARQRRGRCGRVTDGICVRLYDEEDFESRPDFTDPEILRSNLAGVVLQMEHLGLGDPLEFPFVDRPQPKRVAQAWATLEEIDAVRRKGRSRRLTEVGETLARLPLDPRLGRLLVAARDERCLREGLVIASALSVQDPRERPREKQEQADQAHAGFRDKRSDFTGWLRWWHAIGEARKTSNNEVRRLCRERFLNFRRTREWINLHGELRDLVRDELRWELPDDRRPLPDPQDTYSEPLHRAILAAIPSHIGCHQGRKLGYRGARGKTFFLFPGSGLFGSAPPWVMAFEIVETARLYARDVAAFDPTWLEKVAPHLCRHRFSNPHWVPEQGAVYGEETVLAFGLPIIEKRRVHYGRIDPAKAREIFILEALVNGNTRSPLPALARNRETLLAAERLEHKLRRLGGLVHPEAVAAFYEERVPRDVCTQKDFEQWAARQPPRTLELTLDDCLLPQMEPIDPDGVPDTLEGPAGEGPFALRYLHDPGDEAADGITAVVPLAALPHLPDWFGDWLVPGWLPEKAAALFRALPKEIRRRLPPHRDTVEAFLDSWEGFEPQCPLVDAVVESLATEHGIDARVEDLDLDRVPGHLAMRFEVVDDRRKPLASGRDLRALRQRLAPDVRARFSKALERSPFHRDGLRGWTIGDLPDEADADRHVRGFPGLLDPGDGTVGLRLWPSEACARRQHRLGVARLFRVADPERVARLEQALFQPSHRSAARPSAAPQKPAAGRKKSSGGDGFGSLAHAFGGLGGSHAGPPKAPPQPSPSTASRSPRRGDDAAARLELTRDQLSLLGTMGPEPGRNRADLVTLVLAEALGEPRTAEAWASAVVRAREELFPVGARLCTTLSRLLEIGGNIAGMLGGEEPGYAESIADAREHFDRLLMPGWLLAGRLTERLVDLQGLELRLTRMLGSPPAKDLAKLERYRDASAELWAETPSCACGRCPAVLVEADRLDRDALLRLEAFAPELRRRR